MKFLNKNILITVLVAATTLVAVAMESPSQTAQSLVSSIKIGLYTPPESVNFTQIKQYINQLNPNAAELNEVDRFLDGTVLDLVEDRKREFGDYEDQYNEIIRLLKEKGAQNAQQRQYPPERPSEKL